MDSKKYESSLKKYASQYTLPGDTDIWNVPTNHPFEEIDIKWLGQIIENIGDAEWVKDKLPIIKERYFSGYHRNIGCTFW